MANEQTPNELREGQMHLAQEVDALKAEVERLSAPVSGEELLKYGHFVEQGIYLRPKDADAIILARKELSDKARAAIGKEQE